MLIPNNRGKNKHNHGQWNTVNQQDRQKNEQSGRIKQRQEQTAGQEIHESGQSAACVLSEHPP